MGCESACVQLCQSILDALSLGIEGVGYGVQIFCMVAGWIGGIGLPCALLYKFLRGRAEEGAEEHTSVSEGEGEYGDRRGEGQET